MTTGTQDHILWYSYKYWNNVIASLFWSRKSTSFLFWHKLFTGIIGLQILAKSSSI